MIDLAALKDYLTGLAVPGSALTLASTDPRLPPELTTFLKTVPAGQLTLVPGPAGISLSGATLSVSGRTTDSWPVQGFTDLTATLTTATVLITEGTAGVTVIGTASASLPIIAGRAVAVVLHSAVEQSVSAWTISLAGPANGLTARDLLALGQAPDAFTLPVPEALTALDSAVTVTSTDFAITFFPGTEFLPWFSFALTVPDARWTLIDQVLGFTGIDITVFVAPGAYSVTLVSHLSIDRIAVDVSVSMQPAGQWLAFVQPAAGETFPGVAALAQWISGSGSSALSDRTVTGFQNVSFDTATFDLAISSVSISFDPNTATLGFLDIVSVLTIGALKLGVALRLPDVTLSGSLHEGTALNIPALLDSLDLPSTGIPADLQITEAGFNAQPLLGMYGCFVTAENVWAAGPLTLTEVGADISYDPLDGVTGQLDANLVIGSIGISLTAEYAGNPGGWTFSGATLPGSTLAIGDLISTLATKFGINKVPDVLTSLALTSVAASYQTGTGNFTFACEGGFTVAGAPATLAISIAIIRTSTATAGENTVTGTLGYAAHYTGQLIIGPLVFDIVFNFDETSTNVVISAAWTAPAGSFLGFADLANALGLPPPQLPDGLDLRLSAAKLTYNVTKGQFVIAARSASYGNAVFVATSIAPSSATPSAAAPATEYFATLAVGHDIDLSGLPLLGEDETLTDMCAVKDLQVVLSSATLDAAAASAVNTLVPGGYPTFPSEGTTAPIALSATLRFDTETIPISLGTTAATTDPSAATVVGPSEGGSAVVATPPTQSDGTVWFTVQKPFGPVTVDRIGVRYDEGTLWFLLDASLRVGGLSLSLQGASIGSPITTFEPRFELRGLGLAYVNPPLAIGGGFARVEPTGGADFEYDGAVVVSLPQGGLIAYGSYAQVGGEPSLFIFMQARGNLGGPPAFFITGLVLGFGYNSSVRIPAPDAIITSPLVAGLTKPELLGGPAATPMQALAALTGGRDPWIRHALGETWLAAGVSFTTYKLLESTALLLVEAGNELTVALMGISTARFPSSTSQRPYAQLQLQLLAVLRPADGVFGITATLTRNSFLIDPACVLTGGFAFFAWFEPSPLAGDFVVVIGGYHPNFMPPPHYPLVPRVGFSWSLDSTVSIAGTAYFALTPSAIMAGGALAVTYHDGNLRAWFTAHADLIITWSPFHFLTTIGISVGVSYTGSFLGVTKTLQLEASADLTLWGPPTGGQAHIRLWIVSFTVAFGALPTPAPSPLTWLQFQELLPPPGSATTFAVTAGLTPQQTDNAALANATSAAVQDTTTPWLVRADGLAFTVRSAVPSTQLFLGSQATAPFQTGSPLNIRPMQLAGLKVDQRLSITTDKTEINLTTGWTVTALTAALPKALWGTGPIGTLDPGNAQLLPDQLIGFAVHAPPPVPGYSPGSIAAGAPGIDPITPSGHLPIALGTPASGDLPQAATDTVATIAAEIATTATSSRNEIFRELTTLGFAPPTNGSVTAFAGQVGTLFPAEPLTVKPPPAPSGVLYHSSLSPDGTWWPWVSYFNNAPTGVQSGFTINGVTGYTEVFLIDTNGKLWHNSISQTSNWKPQWDSDPNNPPHLRSIFAINGATGNTEIFLIDTNGKLWHNYLTPAGTWSPWVASLNNAPTGIQSGLAINGATGNTEIFLIEQITTTQGD